MGSFPTDEPRLRSDQHRGGNNDEDVVGNTYTILSGYHVRGERAEVEDNLRLRHGHLSSHDRCGRFLQPLPQTRT